MRQAADHSIRKNYNGPSSTICKLIECHLVLGGSHSMGQKPTKIDNDDTDQQNQTTLSYST